MMTIYKYPVSAGRFSVEMPKGARVLSVAMQHGDMQMWALVDPRSPKERRQFAVFATGVEIFDDYVGHFVGTFLLYGGTLVFHLFDLDDDQ
jgi:hypothetical protein